MNFIKPTINQIDSSFVRKINRLAGGAKPRVIDLFSGCGGFSLGFHRAGFEILAGVEIDPEAASSHAVNFHGADLPKTTDEKSEYSCDITSMEPATLISRLGLKTVDTAVDVLIGGPPCQSYARVGRAKLRDVAEHPKAYKVDPRGNLYLRYIHYVRVLKPLVIVMENVPDVLNYGGHNVAEETAELLQELGYVCRYTLLNAVHFGVPQMRERMFLVAYHKNLGNEVSFPEPTHGFKLPPGYSGSRSVALKHLCENGVVKNGVRFVFPPVAKGKTKRAVAVENALKDLPIIFGPKQVRRGCRKLNEYLKYSTAANTLFQREMRGWPGFKIRGETNAHVIRTLPRDDVRPVFSSILR